MGGGVEVLWHGKLCMKRMGFWINSVLKDLFFETVLQGKTNFDFDFVTT